MNSILIKKIFILFFQSLLFRYNKITAFLDKHQISYKEDLLGDGEKVIVIGAIKITSPYARNNVVSANMNAVRKTTALLKDVLEES